MKKIYFGWRSFLLLAVLCIGVLSCYNDDDDAKEDSLIVGTWIGGDQFDYMESIWTFYGDGTFEQEWLATEFGYSNNTITKGTYFYDPDSRILTETHQSNGSTRSNNYTVLSLTKEQLVIFGVDNDGTFTRTFRRYNK